MRYLWQHIQSLIDTYNGSVPLTHFLRKYCKSFPKLGSRDRRILSAAVYSWYRCIDGLSFYGKPVVNDPDMFEKCVQKSLQLCNAMTKETMRLTADIQDQTEGLLFDAGLLCPEHIQLSKGIEREDWLHSMLIQPRLFIRIRKERHLTERLLAENNIPFVSIGDDCLSLPNGTAIDRILPDDCFVVQDASSQATGSLFTPMEGERWLDCCAGAGGKSLLLMDKGLNIHLTVADRRSSILKNLKERFIKYNLPVPEIVVADMASGNSGAAFANGSRFDNIICDAPCSGSGTWSRTPEQLHFFEPTVLGEFTSMQTAIAVNAVQYLKPGGKLYYITCSVFRRENEEVVEAVASQTGLRVQHQQIINGIDNGADSMFVAVLQ